MCPITMTHASFATLRLAAALLDASAAQAAQPRLRPRFRPVNEKTSVTIGMGMTEKQGGTDVRANITQADGRIGGRRDIRDHGT